MIYLYCQAAGGVAELDWRSQAVSGESYREVAIRQLKAPGALDAFLAAEMEGRLAGMMHAYPLAAEIEFGQTGGADTPAAMRPFKELTLRGVFHISAIAIDPAYRGCGIGSPFLRFAEEMARGLSLPALALKVFEENAPALKLYQKWGFEEVDRRAVVPDPVIRFGGDVLLMKKTV